MASEVEVPQFPLCVRLCDKQLIDIVSYSRTVAGAVGTPTHLPTVQLLLREKAAGFADSLSL